MTSPKRFAVASFLAAVLAALFTAFAPLGTTCSSSGTPGGPAGEEVCRNVSIFQHDGSWVLVVVSVPVLFALVPVLLRRRAARVVAAVLLWAFCVVGLASVGLFFVPAATLMTIAAIKHDEPAPAPANAPAFG